MLTAVNLVLLIMGLIVVYWAVRVFLAGPRA